MKKLSIYAAMFVEKNSENKIEKNADMRIRLIKTGVSFFLLTTNLNYFSLLWS